MVPAIAMEPGTECRGPAGRAERPLKCLMLPFGSWSERMDGANGCYDQIKRGGSIFSSLIFPLYYIYWPCLEARKDSFNFSFIGGGGA